jgi:hypothetical protein
MFLISWSNSSSWSVGLVAFLFWLRASRRERVSWYGSSGCSAAAPVAEAFFGGMIWSVLAEGGQKEGSPEVGANVGDLLSNAIN